MQKTFFSFLLSTTVVFAGEKFDPPSLSHPLNTLSSQVTSLREPGESTSLPSAPPLKKQKREEYLFLSEDVIGYIASFLPIADGMRMSHTCKSWDKALNSSSTWEGYAKRFPGYSVFNNNPLYLAHNVKLTGKSLFMRLLTPTIFYNPDSNVTFKYMSNDAAVMVGEQGTIYATKETSSPHTDNVFTQPVVWRKGQKSHKLLPLLIENEDTYITAISGDGKVIIGQVYPRDKPKGAPYTVKWTDEGIQQLEFSKDVTPWEPKAISADGKVIIGEAGKKVTEQIGAVKWTDEGIQPLEYYEGIHLNAVNADGTVSVGIGFDNNRQNWNGPCAVKCTKTGTIFLPPLPHGEEGESHATAINSTGTVIGGWAEGEEDSYFVKWTEKGIQPIGNFEWGGEILSISDNGNILALAGYDPLSEKKRGVLFITVDRMISINIEDYFTQCMGKKFIIDDIYSMNAETGTLIGDLLTEEGDKRNFIGLIPPYDLFKKEGLKTPFSL